VVQVEFDAETNAVYTLFTSDSPGGPWVPHPSCVNQPFLVKKTYKLWDAPTQTAQFFKLEIQYEDTIYTETMPKLPEPFMGPPEPASQPPIPGGSGATLKGN
jgi:hypothetical protein